MSLIDFLQALANDPQALASYKQDPSAAISSAGLTDQDRAALLSKDPTQIRQAIAAETQSGGANLKGDLVVVVIVAP